MSPTLVDVDALAAFCAAVLRAAGADAASAGAATRAMMHGSIHGVDSHGVRLLDHYVRALQGGRLNRRPTLRFERTRPASGLLDGDHAQGALPTYRAADHACEMAAETGIAAVGIRNSSHFGPAGAYALQIAQNGLIGLVFGNSDAFVRLHEGAVRFHGTNPIAVAVPVGDGDPWLLDMATSAITYNKIGLFRSLGRSLPEGAVSDAEGRDTTEPSAAEMLAPLGAEFGFKGAGLAGMAEIFSAVLTGMNLSHEILPMPGPDWSTPRGLGAFVMALDPDAFAGGAALHQGMTRYLSMLRDSPARPGGTVMAPGDREWREAALRREFGIPLDPATAAAFARLSEELAVALPTPLDPV